MTKPPAKPMASPARRAAPTAEQLKAREALAEEVVHLIATRLRTEFSPAGRTVATRSVSKVIEMLEAEVVPPQPVSSNPGDRHLTRMDERHRRGGERHAWVRPARPPAAD